MQRKILAAKILAAFLLFAPGLSFGAGIPVFDGANAVQTAITAFENVNQTLKQLQQNATQLQQLENQIKNTATPAAYLWQEAEATMRNIQRLQGQLSDIYSTVGNLDSYLDNFKDVDYYRALLNNPNVSREEIMKSEEWLMAQKLNENREMLKALAARKDALDADARTLDRLSQMTGTAQGRMEAMQYANQFASLQNSQLLQLRGVLETMQHAAVTKDMEEQQRQARLQARHEEAISGEMSIQKAQPVPRMK
jgi:P-type conjugative transfer protein TrbJ